MSFVVQVSRRARGHVSAAMILWSLVMTLMLIIWEVSPASDGRALSGGLGATVVFGAYLGWRRRGAAVFVAPLVNWSFAWLPLWLAAMFRHGFVKGLFVGFFLVTFGWVVVGTMEFLTLGGLTLAMRLLRGDRRPLRRDDVRIFGPTDIR